MTNNQFRLFGFEDGERLIILNHAIKKKSQKVLKKDIILAQKRKKEYLNNE